MTVIHLKIKTDSEIRRISVDTNENLSFVRDSVNKLFAGSLPVNYSLKYEDEEKDKISIVNDSDWREAASFAETQNGYLILFVESTGELPPAIPADDEVSKLEKEFVFLSSVDLPPQAKEVLDQAFIGAKDIFDVAKEKFQTIVEGAIPLIEEALPLIGEALPKAQNEIQNFFSKQNADEVVLNLQNFVQSIEERLDNFIPKENQNQNQNQNQSSDPSVLGAKLVRDVTINDGTVIAPNTPFQKTWELKNDGTKAWPKGVQVKPISAIRFSPETFYDIRPIEVGESIEFTVDLLSPAEPGKYRSFYRLFHPDTNSPIGDIFWVDITVPTPYIHQDKLNQLIEMGFEESICRFLLDEHSGNVEECMIELTNFS